MAASDLSQSRARNSFVRGTQHPMLVNWLGHAYVHKQNQLQNHQAIGVLQYLRHTHKLIGVSDCPEEVHIESEQWNQVGKSEEGFVARVVWRRDKKDNECDAGEHAKW